jgi:hypothetical protein
VRLLGGWVVARQFTRRAIRPVTPEIRARAQRVAGRLALERIVRVLESSVVSVPMLVGWMKPVVLLPAAALARLAPAQIEALLAHELSHVRRHDYLVNLLQAVVETLLFYHPAVWWLSRQVRREREHCCDDLAIGVCGDPLVYATALSELAAMSAGPRLALAATDGSLLDRVRRILGHPRDRRASPSGWVSLVFVTLLIGVLIPAVAARRGVLSGQATSSGDRGVSEGQELSSGAADRLTPPTEPQDGVTRGRPDGPSSGVLGGVLDGVAGGVTGSVPGGVAAGVPRGVADGGQGGVQGGVRSGVEDGVELQKQIQELELERLLDEARKSVEKATPLRERAELKLQQAQRDLLVNSLKAEAEELQNRLRDLERELKMVGASNERAPVQQKEPREVNQKGDEVAAKIKQAAAEERRARLLEVELTLREKLRSAEAAKSAAFEAFVSQPTSRVTWSKEVGRLAGLAINGGPQQLGSERTWLVFTALIVAHASAPSRPMRGVRIDFEGGVAGAAPDQVFIDEADLQAVMNTIYRNSARCCAGEPYAAASSETGIAGPSSATAWYKIPPLLVGYPASGDRPGFGFAAKRQVLWVRDHDSSELADVFAKALDELKAR